MHKFMIFCIVYTLKQHTGDFKHISIPQQISNNGLNTAKFGPPSFINKSGNVQDIPLFEINNRVNPYKVKESFCGVKDIKQQRKNTRRRKRSVVEDMTIEALFVTDPTVTIYYKDQDLEIYIYTLIDMVNAIYHHYSLGYSIKIKLSALIMLESKPASLNMTSNADSYLKSFCAWQLAHVKNITGEKEGINRYNTAILLTRKDICANNDTPCGTLGLAEVGAICQLERSCSIAEDTGLSTAFTIAHELGHLFGMKHDTLDNCNSLHQLSTLPYVMAPRLPQNLLSELIWSNCSYKDATIFIERRFAQCLIVNNRNKSDRLINAHGNNLSFTPAYNQYIDLDIDVEIDNTTADDHLIFDDDIGHYGDLIRKVLNPIIANHSDLDRTSDELKNQIAKALADMLKTHPSLRSQNITIRGTIVRHSYESPNTSTDKKTQTPILKFDVNLDNISQVINIGDAEHELISLVSNLPLGVLFNMDAQCQLLFGIQNITHCPGIDEVCDHLWCKVGHKCMSKMRVPEDGTPCGSNKWCMSKLCIDIYQTDLWNLKGLAVDGDWGPWSNWSHCSRTCGIGLSMAYRSCDNPRPSNGGKFCLGLQRKYVTCNTELCAEKSDIRDLQCQKYGCDVMKKCHLNWTFDVKQSAFSPHTLCLLYCKSEGGENFNLGYDVIPNLEDSSPCDPKNDINLNTNEGGICIEGVCHALGCDRKLNSSAVRDECDVCNGNNDTCIDVKGNFSTASHNGSQILQSTWGGGHYLPIGYLPKGSFKVKLSELQPSPNFLALATENRRFILNGNNTITWNGVHTQIGITYNYTRDNNEREIIKVKGPLKQKIIIYQLALGELPSENDSILFFYKQHINPFKNSSDLTNFTQLKYRSDRLFWDISDWSPCSKTCGNGTQKSIVVCKAEINQRGISSQIITPDKICQDHLIPLNLPKIRICNSGLCPAYWWTADWQPCPVTCGSQSVQSRSILCMQDITTKLGVTRQVLPNVACRNSIRPSQVRPCSYKLCPTLLNLTNKYVDVTSSNTCSSESCLNTTLNKNCSSPFTNDCDAKNSFANAASCNTSGSCKPTWNETSITTLIKKCTSLDSKHETLIFNNITACRKLYNYCKKKLCDNLTLTLENKPFERKRLIHINDIRVFKLKKIN